MKYTITTKHFPAVHYRRLGHGPAVMLLHGFPASGILWDGLVPHLAQTHTVLVPDFPPPENATSINAPMSLEILATIIPAILDDAAIKNCVLVGHSMGGYVALAALEAFKDRFYGLSLVHSTALADDEEKKEKRKKSIALIQKCGHEGFIKGMIPLLFSDQFKQDNPSIIQAIIQDGLSRSAASIIEFTKAMIERPDRRETIRRARIPVQWITGLEDTTIPWQTALQQSTLTDVNFISAYAQCAHMGMIEQKELLLKDLLKFVKHCLQSTQTDAT